MLRVADRDAHYANRRWNLAAGLFSGSWSDISWLYAQMNQEIIRCLQGPYPGLEELMLNIIYVQHRERFVVYYGDYHQILCNHDRYRTNFDIIQRNINDCLRLQLWPQLRHLCSFLLAGDLPADKLPLIQRLLTEANVNEQK